MQKPFREILRASRMAAGKRLLEKACVANRLAKITHGNQLARLYSLKQRYVFSAMQLLPETFALDLGPGETNPAIVGVQTKAGYAFHLPGDVVRASLHISIGVAGRLSVEAHIA